MWWALDRAGGLVYERLRPRLEQQVGRLVFAVGFQPLDELLGGFPDAEALVGAGVPVLLKFRAV